MFALKCEKRTNFDGNFRFYEGDLLNKFQLRYLEKKRVLKNVYTVGYF